MLDIKVETFLTVCKVLNFTKAAKILNITQPAVSMHIKHLEEYYHAPLFQFEGKHFHLTKYGQLLYESLSSMRNNEKQLKDQLRIIKSRNNIINMGATLTVGEFMISRPIGRYLQENPDTEVTVTVSNTKELLAKLDLGQIDFAILEGDFPKSTYA
ncbi:MAG: LysR family transcriptional regulator, partial [Anaerovoracaceae bacterium]